MFEEPPRRPWVGQLHLVVRKAYAGFTIAMITCLQYCQKRGYNKKTLPWSMGGWARLWNQASRHTPNLTSISSAVLWRWNTCFVAHLGTRYQHLKNELRAQSSKILKCPFEDPHSLAIDYLGSWCNLWLQDSGKFPLCHPPKSWDRITQTTFRKKNKWCTMHKIIPTDHNT